MPAVGCSFGGKNVEVRYRTQILQTKSPNYLKINMKHFETPASQVHRIDHISQHVDWLAYNSVKLSDTYPVRIAPAASSH